MQITSATFTSKEVILHIKKLANKDARKPEVIPYCKNISIVINTVNCKN